MKCKEVKVYDLMMYNMSLSMLFGKSPKIHMICGECRNYSSGRIDMTQLRMTGDAKMRCEHCNTINILPLELD